MTGAPLGPFETKAQASAAARAVMAPQAGDGVVPAERSRRLLGCACQAAGIGMGRWDDQVVEWLAGSGDAVCAAVAGWVARAHAPGRAAAAAGAGVADPAAVTVPGLLHAAADSLAVDLAVWAARDPAAPSPAARQARRSAVAAASAVIVSLSALRSRLEGGRQ
jgi:hypothetical protein